MIVPVVYIVVFLLTFFAASFAVARYSWRNNPTDPDVLWLLVPSALMWPVTIPLAAAIFFLIGIAKLAEKLAGGAR